MQKLTAVWAFALALVAGASAQTLTIEDIWKKPQLASPTLSKSGKYLAATAPYKGRLNLLVMDMDTRKGTLLTSFEDYDVQGVTWVGDDRLLFTLGQFNSPTGPGQFDGGGLFVIGRDGSGSRRLAPTVRETRARNQFVYRGLEVHRTIRAIPMRSLPRVIKPALIPLICTVSI